MRKILRPTLALLPLILFLIIAIFLWIGLGRNPNKLPSTFIDKPVPNFAMSSLEKPKQLITNKEFLGHISLLNVWATWCYSCRAEHSVLMQIAKSKKVKVYGLNYKDNRQKAIKWLHEYGDPYINNIYDQTGQLAIDLGVYGTPETFLIDAKGVIRYKYTGPISPTIWQDDLLPRIERLRAQLQNNKSRKHNERRRAPV